MYISKSGQWYRLPSEDQLNLKLLKINLTEELEPITVNFADRYYPWQSINGEHRYPCDIVFPIMHGTRGEDGALQGLFEMLNVPYVSSGVLGSSVCMDKHVSKSLMRQAGLPTVDWYLVTRENAVNYTYEQMRERFGDILFIKPANLGSSVGISKVRNADQFKQALQEALNYDHRVLIEAYIEAREIECSVLGNENPVASLPGEIIPTLEFYSYEAKYVDPDGAKVITPAELSQAQIDQIQQLSVQAFQVLACDGMARVDFFVTEDKVFLNEINTIPGFTNISMYPKNWEASGVGYSELIDRLITLGINRYQQQQLISRSIEKLTTNQTTAHE